MFILWLGLLIILPSFLNSQPANITDLTAISTTALPEGSIKLTWTYPGPDTLPLGSTYYIFYSTFTEDGMNWEAINNKIEISTGLVNKDDLQTYLVSQLDNFVKNNNLQKETTFYFVVKISSVDATNSLSNTATGWITLIPPTKVTNYTLQAGFKHLTLIWYFPYDDETEQNTNPYTGSYEIRYRDDIAITDEELWNSATSVLLISNHTITPNVSTTTVIDNLSNGTSYYLGIKFYDDLGNYSLSSTTFKVPFNSSPTCSIPNYHFAFCFIQNSTSTVISSTTVKITWENAGWTAGVSYQDGSYDVKYGDTISSYTIRISSYLIGSSLGSLTTSFHSITLSSITIDGKDLFHEDTTYYWNLTCYDSLGLSSTTKIFSFLINAQNSPPQFPTEPLICPTTVCHTNTYTITFSWKQAIDPDPFDSICGYAIFISSDNSQWYRIPQLQDQYINLNSTNIKTTEQYCWSIFEQTENNKIYWYVAAYDNADLFGHLKSSTTTETASFWLNQIDEPPRNFEICFPSGTPILINNATFYKVIVDGITYYPLMEKFISGNKYYIAKSTPIIISWYPGYDPDPEDGVEEYAIHISSYDLPENVNPWRRCVRMPPPYSEFFSTWTVFTSTWITNFYEPGDQGYDLELKENEIYNWRIRAYREDWNIWKSTENWAPQKNTIISFAVDFTSEEPKGYDLIFPTGSVIVNPHSLQGPITFYWELAQDPDPYDSIKYYYICISTKIPSSKDGWFGVNEAGWKGRGGPIPHNVSTYPYSSATIEFFPGTTYYWQILCWGENEWGNYTDEDHPWYIKPYGMALTTGSFIISNTPPNKFNILSPGTTMYEMIPDIGVKTFTPTFYWELATDNDLYDANISSYWVVISSFPDFYVFTYTTGIVTNAKVKRWTNTTYYSLTEADKLEPRTTYYWLVVAYDKYAGNSTLSRTTFYFQTVNFEPNNFQIVYPTNNVIVPTCNPQLKWQNKGDPDNDTVFYRVEYSSSSDFEYYASSGEWNNLGLPLGSTITISSPWTFEENKQYFWRVIARDDFGGITTSTVHSFYINAQEEPPNDFDIIPTSGVINQQFINFAWNYTYDNDPNDYIKHYKLSISTISNYIIGISSYIIVSSNTTNWNFDISTLKENAAYLWWVEAYDTKNYFKKSSSSYVFIVDLSTESPDIVTLDIEEKFILLNTTHTYTNQPTLKWTAGNKKEWWKSINYAVYLGTFGYLAEETTSFVSPIYSNYQTAISTFVYYKVPYLLNENTTYYWWIKIWNSSATLYSSTYYFFVDALNQPPENFSLISPPTNYFYSSLTRKPKFEWELTYDNDDKITEYKLILSQFSDFSITFSTSLSPNTSFYIPTDKLPQNTTIYWKVECYDIRYGTTTAGPANFFIPFFKPQPVDEIVISTSPSPWITSRKPKINFSTLTVTHPEPNSYIMKYKVKILNSLTNQTIEEDFVLTSSTPTYYLKTNLPQNITYYIIITSIDDDNIESEPKIKEYFVPLFYIPKKVDDISCDIDNNFITLYWKKISVYENGEIADDLKGYNLYRAENIEDLGKPNITPHITLPISSTTYRDFLYTTYYYLIKTVTLGDIESAPSDIITSYNSGSYIISEPQQNPQIRLIIPKSVFKELKEKNYTITCNLQLPEIYEIQQLNLLSKYNLELKEANQSKPNYKFVSPLEIEFVVSSQTFTTELKPAVFYHNGIEYIFVNTEYNIQKNVIKSQIFKPGIYAIRMVYMSSKPEVVQVYPRKIFTPTSNNEKFNKIHFVINNPTLYQPEGEVYDINLRFVSKLKYENGELIWDGKYESGEIVPKGIYIYQIKIENTVYTGSIIVAK